MPQAQQIRGGMYVAAMVAAFGVSGACAQAPGSTLPPTPPTAMQGNHAVPAPGAAPASGATAAAGTAQPVSPPHRAQVTYSDGELHVRADNSSLNQILRAISRQIGLKITGGVLDQRVFGEYGPASASTVLATLLDGTGTNILLLGGDATNPPELILTPRAGGPMPPGPDSAAYAMYDEGPAVDNPPQSAQRSANPSGTLTPQQVAQELLKMQQQQQSKPPSTAPQQ